jgi:hypothetical protein
MTSIERVRERSTLYSRWHREQSTRRFLAHKEAWELGNIDIDECVYCRYCNVPLALLEIKRSDERLRVATVTTRLARRAGLPAYTVVYTPDSEDGDFESFEVRQVAHVESPVGEAMTPDRYAKWLHRFQSTHKSECETQRRVVS